MKVGRESSGTPIGDDAALDERTDELVAVTTEQSFPQWLAHGAIYRGWIKVRNGDVMDGISLLRSGLAGSRAAAAVWTPYHIALLAAACKIARQIDKGLTLLNDALQIVERTRGLLLRAELNRHKGQLVLRQGHTAAAEELYRKALGIAEEQEAKLWKLRAAASLARLRRDQAAAPKPMTSSRRSTAGSPKASTHKISKKRRRCSMSWREPVITGASASF
jgi:hypothetical protein